MTHPEESSGRPTHVLVTGATGLVGNNVVRYLLEQGTSVRVVIRPTANRRPINGLDVEVVEGDITDLESIHRAVPGSMRLCMRRAASCWGGATNIFTIRSIDWAR